MSLALLDLPTAPSIWRDASVVHEEEQGVSLTEIDPLGCPAHYHP